MSGNPTIELENIKKIYPMGTSGVTALAGIDLTVETGEMVAIMGSSGSGKSTLLNLLGCLDRPTTGNYRLTGENVSAMTKTQLAAIRNREIGFVFQGFNLLGKMTALHNVELPLIYTGAGKSEMARRAAEALGWVGLTRFSHHLPNQLSGGQQQRVAIARALVNNPTLILADEPTGALDSRTSLEIMAVIQRLHRERGITIVIVTHEPEIAGYCQRLIRLKDGCIISDQPVNRPGDALADLARYPAAGEVNSL
ncbi:MAG: ABC transporter ATP-binding protein [Heliobacteriaceae bacterium]|nr:ABC transporter ATP-binding protein [Heliobacteriaceae bacterium]